MITISADILPAVEWIVCTVNERDDCSLISMTLEGGHTDRTEVCASVLVSQEAAGDWYERARALEDEWATQFPGVNADLTIVPWPQRVPPSIRRLLD